MCVGVLQPDRRLLRSGKKQNKTPASGPSDPGLRVVDTESTGSAILEGRQERTQPYVHSEELKEVFKFLFEFLQRRVSGRRGGGAG